MPRYCTLIPLLVCATALNAQERRLTIGPLVSITDASPIFDHTTTMSDPTFGTITDFTQLSVRRATTVGARVTYRIAGPWTVSAEGSHGGSRYEYISRLGGSDGTFAEERRRGDAGVSTVALRLGRRFDLPGGVASAEASLGGAVQRLDVRGYPPCELAPPSMGFVTYRFVPCGSERWQRSYDVPSVIAGLYVSQRVGTRLLLYAGGNYAIGRANTDAFWTDLLPEFDSLEAPKSHGVRAAQLSAGLAVGLGGY